MMTNIIVKLFKYSGNAVRNADSAMQTPQCFCGVARNIGLYRALWAVLYVPVSIVAVTLLVVTDGTPSRSCYLSGFQLSMSSCM